MAYRRKQYLLEPLESLLITQDVVKHSFRLGEFVDDSGLEIEQVTNLPICSIPLPAPVPIEAGVRRFADAKTSFLWHPLMWLPERTATQQMITGVDGELRLELGVEWSARVALELMSSGLYDVEDGTWLDVLALHHLDIENPVDFARVEAWQAGAADPILDHIDVDDLIQFERDERWSFNAIQDLMVMLVPAQWSILAGSLEQVLVTECAHMSGDEQRGLASLVVELGVVVLGNAPVLTEESEVTVFALLDVLDQLADADADVTQALNDARDLLLSEQEKYSVAVELVQQSFVGLD